MRYSLLLMLLLPFCALAQDAGYELVPVADSTTASTGAKMSSKDIQLFYPNIANSAASSIGDSIAYWSVANQQMQRATTRDVLRANGATQSTPLTTDSIFMYRSSDGTIRRTVIPSLLSGSNTILTDKQIPYIRSGFMAGSDSLTWGLNVLQINGRVGIGTTTPTSKLSIVTNSLAATQDTTAGIGLINLTPATVGATVQISPAIRWFGSAWKSSATAASQNVEFRSFVLPVTGASITTGLWKLQSQINGPSTGWNDVLTVDNAGRLTTFNSLTISTSSTLTWSGRSFIYSPADGDIAILNNAGSSFTKLQFGGTTNLFPSWKRSTTFLQARLADDSGNAGITTGVIAIGSATAPVASAVCEMTSTTQGLLTPRMTTTQRDAISSPAEGLEIYNLTTHTKEFFNGTVWKTITTN